MTLCAKLLKALCRCCGFEKRADHATPRPRPAGRSYLVAKVKDEIQVPADRPGRDALLAKYGWKDLEERFGRRLPDTDLFGPKALAALREQTKNAQRKPGFKPAKFEQYLRIDPVPPLPPPALRELAKALGAGLPAGLFERAYVHRPGPPPQVNWQDDPRAVEQGHLDGGGIGVNAKTAWAAFPGADGAPKKGPAPKFRNVDCGWRFLPPAPPPAPAAPLGPIDHEDLDTVQLNPPPVENDWSMTDHGTEMLGIVLARDNQLGVVGIVPNLPEVGLVYYDPFYDPADPYTKGPNDIPNAVATAMAGLQVGDVILIEAQAYHPDNDTLAPVEIYYDEYEAIRTATAAGIIVIEPCGNGTFNGPPVLNVDAELKHGNSDAILVTAASSTSPHHRLPYTAYGSRIDCYAWGVEVLTCTDYGSRQDYGPSRGTSAASAIIAGVALAVQCAYIEKRAAGTPPRIDGPAMRQLLRNSAYGTPPVPGDEPIGSMPDLHTVISNL